jgi:hypothetical protein
MKALIPPHLGSFLPDGEFLAIYTPKYEDKLTT